MTTALTPPLLQFGTGRFLQAHVDCFVSQALDAGEAGQAGGGIAVVQSTASPASSERLLALRSGAGYPVHLRGLQQGELVDTTVHCHAVHAAWQAEADWPQLLDAMAGGVRIIVSNTADQGFVLNAQDDAGLIGHPHRVPSSYPGKLLVLLHHRWQQQPAAELSIYPCELVERNGDMLRDIVGTLAQAWQLPAAFQAWARTHCVWANSLVDRIVSEALHPIGAVAEPYALWAIERQPRLQLPCRHPSIVLTEDLAAHERLKLFLLNAGHSLLVESWHRGGAPEGMTVGQAMRNAELRGELEAFWVDEALPVFDALGQGVEARRYLEDLRERLANPFLAHRLADIAQNHAAKKQRRLAPLLALANQHTPQLPAARLRRALATAN